MKSSTQRRADGAHPTSHVHTAGLPPLCTARALMNAHAYHANVLRIVIVGLVVVGVGCGGARKNATSPSKFKIAASQRTASVMVTSFTRIRVAGGDALVLSLMCWNVLTVSGPERARELSCRRWAPPSFCIHPIMFHVGSLRGLRRLCTLLYTSPSVPMLSNDGAMGRWCWWGIILTPLRVDCLVLVA